MNALTTTTAPDLTADEQRIADLVLSRLRDGRTAYGPWRTDDGRDYPREALLEVIDALHYCAAELVRIERARPAATARARRVYVCHPYRSNPRRNADIVRVLCRALSQQGLFPVAPQIYLPQFVHEATERDRALAFCLDLVASCDEVRVYGDDVTEGMRREIDLANALGIQVRYAGVVDPEPED